jgi:hypothetical protein
MNRLREKEKEKEKGKGKGKEGFHVVRDRGEDKCKREPVLARALKPVMLSDMSHLARPPMTGFAA